MTHTGTPQMAELRSADGAGTSRSMTTVAAAVEMRIIKLHIGTHGASESNDFGPHKQ